VAIKPATGPAVVVTGNALVDGATGNSSWDLTQPANALIAADFANYAGAVADAPHVQTEGTFAQQSAALLSWAAGIPGAIVVNAMTPPPVDYVPTPISVEAAPAGTAPTGRKLYVGAGADNTLGVYWIDRAGSIQRRDRDEAGHWAAAPVRPVGPDSLAAPETNVTVGYSAQADLFWIGQDGAIWWSPWDDASDAWGMEQFAPPGTASPQGGIVAQNVAFGFEDVWWISPTGAIWLAQWNEVTSWGGRPMQPMTPDGVASPQSSLSTTGSYVFWLGPDGEVYEASYTHDEAHNPNPFTFDRLAPAGTAAVTGGITSDAVAMNFPYYDRASTCVAWISPAGSAQAMWLGGAIQTLGSGVSTTGGIAALAVPRTGINLWWVGADSSIQSAFSGSNKLWNTSTWAPPGSAAPEGPLGATYNSLGKGEFLWTGTDGSIQNRYEVENYFWYEGCGPWNFCGTISASDGSDLTIKYKVTINADGSMRHQGTIITYPDTTFPMVLGVAITPASGPPVVVVRGWQITPYPTFIPFPWWDVTIPPDPAGKILANLGQYPGATVSAYMPSGGDLQSMLKEARDWAATFPSTAILQLP